MPDVTNAISSASAVDPNRAAGVSAGNGAGTSPNGALQAPQAAKTPKTGATDTVTLSPQAKALVAKLQARDADVRAHEEAHIAAGGSLVTGGPSFTYEKGPDGRSYAVGGEVSIDSSPVRGNPKATVAKELQVEAAALAPADPSGQDLSVASAAAAAAAQAAAQVAAGAGQGTSEAKTPGTAKQDTAGANGQTGAAGTTPGTTGKAAPGTTGGAAPGTTGGTAPGTAGPTTPGTTGGTAPGTAGGTTPGTGRGTITGTAGGGTPGAAGGETNGATQGTQNGSTRRSTYNGTRPAATAAQTATAAQSVRQAYGTTGSAFGQGNQARRPGSLVDTLG